MTTRPEVVVYCRLATAVVTAWTEHAGDINGDGYLDAMIHDGIVPTDDDPVVVHVWDCEFGNGQKVTVYDGNHRVLVAAALNEPEVPVVVVFDPDDPGMFPGWDYHGELDHLTPPVEALR